MGFVLDPVLPCNVALKEGPSIVRDDLSEEFKRLWDSKDPNRRGRLFENLFCRLLFKSRFTVQRDPATAKPRQTDVLAEYGRDTFLFEIKWLGEKA